jgi:uncharacterized protein DUF222/HNH endonuclease
MRTDGGVVDPVAGLAAAIGALAEMDVAQLSAGAQLDLLRGLWPQLCRLDAAVTRLVGVVNVRGSAAHDGAVSTVAWLRSWLHAAGAAPRVQVAKALADLPEVAAAFDRGDINFTHAHIATKAAAGLAPDLLAAGADKLLAEQAAGHPPAVFGRAAQRIREHYAPDDEDDRGDRHPELAQWLDVDKTFRGAVSVSGVLAPDTGELFLQTLGSFTRPVDPDELVPATARRADALGQLCRVAAVKAPQAGGHIPQVTVTIDWDTLRGQATALFDRHGSWTGARLGDTTPISPDIARRLACDATILPAVLGGASQPLDVGRLRRPVTPALRRALNLRDGGCRFPGCHRSTTWCDAHHVVPWSRGGETAVDNLLLLCRRHHGLVHEGGWSIHLDQRTGIVTAHGLDGRRLGIVSQPRAHSP